ncbi:CHAT domain-containing protein, partial [Mycena leptocephala]
PARGDLLNELGCLVYTRFGQKGNSRDLEAAISFHRQALAHHGPPHPDCGISLNNLAAAVQTRFAQQGHSRDLEEAITLHRAALALHAPPHPDRGISLKNLAAAVQTQFSQQGDSGDLDEAITLHREALALHAPPHPDCGSSLNNLAAAVQTRFKQKGDSMDLDEAITLYREALALYALPHPDHGMSLNHLANAVRTRFEQQGDSRDLDEIITLHREALALHAPPHPDHGGSLNNVANAVCIRFKQEGDSRDLDEAITLYREALALHAPPHPDRGASLNNLAIAVLTRFEQHGDSGDLDEAITLHREALAPRAPPHPYRGMSLNNLANAVWTKFKQQGDPRDLDEAITLHREALALCAPPYLDRGSPLNNLASAVCTRFKQQGDPRDLKEAITLHREALALHAPPHPYCGMSLNNLASAVLTRFTQQGDSKDLDEAITLHREALALRAPLHPERSGSLNNLANAVQTRFEQQGDSRDLDEIITLHREALALRAPPHPDRGGSLNNVANAVCIRFEQGGDSRDLNQAITLHREALALLAPPHPDCGTSLHSLAVCLVTKYNVLNDKDSLDTACELFQQAATYWSSSPLTRFKHALSWSRTAAKYNHNSSLAAYYTAIELLPQLAALHKDLLLRQQILSTAKGSTLASEAAACAVGMGKNDIAIEFLEAGRSIFWSQALHLRTPLDDLATIRPDFAAKLANLAKKLEQASFRDTSRNRLTDTQQKIMSIESEGRHCQQLNEQWEETIKDVRTLSGFEDFMQPKAINVLKQAAISGPIIVLVATPSTCFALIVTATKGVQSLKLSEMNLPTAKHLSDLVRALSNQAGFDLHTLLEPGTRSQEQSELLDRLFGAREGRFNVAPNDAFRELLAYLWKNIVKPVFDDLKLEVTDSSRLWWCPIGPFAFLPLHAAGIYDEEVTNCTSNYVVSSYTPTLTALLGSPINSTMPFKVSAVIEPHTPNCFPLPGAGAELKRIAEWVPDQWLTPLVNTTVQTARIHLQDSSIVHFACHGVQDLKHPLESGLILSDGRLKVSEIMRRPEGDHAQYAKKSMSLAFLNACETAKGDNKVPDEAMHLAATLLFAGFRGVVATMWTMDDRDGPKIADTFYEHLFKNCDPNSNPPILPDLKQAAKALHLAVAKLRGEPNMPFRRWVPFVHYG